MATEAIRLGPFVGGINTKSDPTAVADAELVDLINMEVGVDAALFSRPPIQDFTNNATWTERIILLGVGVFDSGAHIIGSNVNGVFQFSAGVWTEITDGVTRFEAAAMVQYANLVWLIPKPGETNPGGKWEPVGGFVAVTAIPQGEACTIFKERLFVTPGKNSTTNTSRLKFSEPGNLEDWQPSVNFIDVSQGDGEKLVDLVVYRGNLLLFKEDSTYVLSYDLSPADSTLDNISITIGCTQQRCMATYENTVYVYHEGEIYELISYDFNRLNVKVPFDFDGTAPGTRVENVFLSVIGDKMLVRYFNRIFVWNFLTRTWSKWESADDNLHNFGPWVAFPANQAQDIPNEYYAGSCILANINIFRLKDGYDTATKESFDGIPVDIRCYMKTKNFDLSASHLFKRLYWWGADVLTNSSITGTANPIVFGFQVTWGSLFNQGITWDQTNTWQFPTISPVSVSSDVSVITGVQRRFIKFLKALRFRQINFELETSTDGTTSDGPVRFFTLTMVARVKQTVTKAVS